MLQARTDIGLVRATNQDVALAEMLPDGRSLLVVADGVGGLPGGEVASRTAVEARSSRRCARAGASSRLRSIPAPSRLRGIPASSRLRGIPASRRPKQRCDARSRRRTTRYGPGSRADSRA